MAEKNSQKPKKKRKTLVLILISVTLYALVAYNGMLIRNINRIFSFIIVTLLFLNLHHLTRRYKTANNLLAVSLIQSFKQSPSELGMRK